MSRLHKIVQAAAKKDVRGFQKAFSAEVSSRIAAKIDERKRIVAASLFVKEDSDLKTEWEKLAVIANQIGQKLKSLSFTKKTYTDRAVPFSEYVGSASKKSDISDYLSTLSFKFVPLGDNNYKYVYQNISQHPDIPSATSIKTPVPELTVTMYGPSGAFFGGSLQVIVKIEHIEYKPQGNTRTVGYYGPHQTESILTAMATVPVYAVNQKVIMNTRTYGAASGDGQRGTITAKRQTVDPLKGHENLYDIRLDNGQMLTNVSPTQFSIVNQ